MHTAPGSRLQLRLVNRRTYWLAGRAASWCHPMRKTRALKQRWTTPRQLLLLPQPTQRLPRSWRKKWLRTCHRLDSSYHRCAHVIAWPALPLQL